MGGVPEDRTELVIRSTEKNEEHSLLRGANYSYTDGDQSFEWCPDSHHILCDYQANGGWNNTDIALIDIDTKEVTNLTQSGYNDTNFHWVLGGKAMMWMSDKYGYRSHGSWGSEYDIYAMFFDTKEYYKFTRSTEEEKINSLLDEKSEKEEKAEKKKEKKDSIKVEKKGLDLLLEGRENRIVRLTPHAGNVGDYFLTDDGKTLYFFQRLEKSVDLCSLDIKEGDIKVIRKGFNGSFVASADRKHVYILSGRGINKFNPAGGKSRACHLQAITTISRYASVSTSTITCASR